MDSIVFLEKISIDPPRDKIYQRLGYKENKTAVQPGQMVQTDLLIHEASSHISLQGMFLRLAVDSNNGEKIISGDLTFISKKLSFFLRDCKEIVLMGATAGKSVMDAIREKTSRGEMAAAVVYDAVASETVDAALDWITDYINNLLRREGKVMLPRRFSAGYADFNLENQKNICEKLQMAKFGVGINSSFILIPEKSVTAVGGIC